MIGHAFSRLQDHAWDTGHTLTWGRIHHERWVSLHTGSSKSCECRGVTLEDAARVMLLRVCPDPADRAEVIA